MLQLLVAIIYGLYHPLPTTRNQFPLHPAKPTSVTLKAGFLARVGKRKAVLPMNGSKSTSYSTVSLREWQQEEAATPQHGYKPTNCSYTWAMIGLLPGSIFRTLRHGRRSSMGTQMDELWRWMILDLCWLGEFFLCRSLGMNVLQCSGRYSRVEVSEFKTPFSLM